jgi:hypothetical protein
MKLKVPKCRTCSDAYCQGAADCRFETVEIEVNVNKYLCEKMGIHYHEGIVYPDGHRSIYKCACMEHQSLEPLSYLNPCYNTKEGFWDLWEWVVKQPWFDHFLICNGIFANCDTYNMSFDIIELFNYETFAENVAQYIEDNDL